MSTLAGAALASLAAVGLAGQALTIRLATRRGRSADVLLVNLIITAIFFLVFTLLLVPEPVVTPTSILAFVAAGFVSLVVARSMYFAAIKRVGASRTEPIKASMPLHATVFAVLILGEAVSGPQLVGIVLIIVGIALVTLEGANADRIAGDSVPWVGLSLPLGAAVLFAVEPILASIGFEEGTSVLVGAAIKCVAGVIFLALYLGLRGSIPTPADLPSGDVRWYVLSGVASSLSMLAYYGGLSISRVSVVVPIMQTSPLLVVGASALFLSDLERVSRQLVAAALVVIVGAIAVTVAG